MCATLKIKWELWDDGRNRDEWKAFIHARVKLTPCKKRTTGGAAVERKYRLIAKPPCGQLSDTDRGENRSCRNKCKLSQKGKFSKNEGKGRARLFSYPKPSLVFKWALWYLNTKNVTQLLKSIDIQNLFK